VTDLFAEVEQIVKKSRGRRANISKAARLAKLNGRAHSPATGYRTSLDRPVRKRTAPAAPVAPTILQPVVYVQAPTPKAPVVNVTVPTQKATRTRVVETDEDGIATVTVTEPID
jgi:hypothetical protein